MLSTLMRSLFLALTASAIFVGAAQAAQKIYSYAPADPPTRQRIDSGLTFVFDKGLVGMTVKEIMATEASARVTLDPVGEGDLGTRLDKLLPRDAFERDLYAVSMKDQGPAMIRAFCPGSTKGWLVFSPLRARRGAVIHALGDDPATGNTRYCATLNFDFKGEWQLPPSRLGPPKVGQSLNRRPF